MPGQPADENPRQPKVWARIQQMRRELGLEKLGEGEFAGRLGQERQTYSNWKHGKNAIGGDAILEMARRTGYRAEWILYGTRPKRTAPPGQEVEVARKDGWQDAVHAMRGKLNDMERKPTLRDDPATRVDENGEAETGTGG